MIGFVSDEVRPAAEAQGERVSGERTTRRAYDDMLVLRVTSERGVARIPANVSNASWPYLALYPLSPAELCRQSGSSKVSLRPGECYFAANQAADGLWLVGSVDVLVICIPRESVAFYRRSLERSDGCTCSTEQGIGQLVGRLLDGLAAQAITYESTNPGSFAQHVLGLLTLLLAENQSAETVWSKARVLESSKKFIEQHLADADLTPARIAAAEYMSARNLHRIFESADLTVAGWIRQRRLEHCRRDLSDHSLVGLPVSHIAARWGLWEAAHFSRVFKAAYGVSPRAYRANICRARADLAPV